MKKLLLIIIAFASCTGKNGSRLSDSLTVDTGKTDTTAKAKESVYLKWRYRTEEDPMSSGKTYFAVVWATNTLEFAFPYNGGVRAFLMLRNKEGKTNLMLVITKGQFMANSIDGGKIRIKFDDSRPKTYECTTPSDGSTETLFIHPERSIINKLKKANKIIIETEFYNEGNRQLYFNVAGLKWDH